jgi:hypothetical protein
MIDIILTMGFLILMIMIGSMKETYKTNNDRLNDRIDAYEKSKR